MKKQLVLSGAVAALVGMLAACTGGAEKPAYDDRYLNTDTVNQVDCKTVNMTSLEDTLTYVSKTTSSGTIRDILRRSPDGTTKEQLQDALSDKIGWCKKVHEDTYQTVALDGTGWQLPQAPENVDIVVGDSTKDPDTPAVMPALPEKCRGAINWTNVRDCASSEQWYIDGINQMKPFSGFNWEDVLKWADAKRPDGNPVGDARLVQVFRMGTKQNPQISEKDAKNGVNGLVGNDQLLERMGVAYHDQSFVNTRGLENERVSPFIDPSRQVRVSIAPLILNEKGEAIELNPVGGIFVDCFNIWGKAYAIAPAPNKPALCPNTNMPIPPEGPKGCNPPPGTSTTVTTTTTNPPCEGPQCSPKKPGEAPGQPGAPGDGGKSVYGGDGTERHAATGTPAPPAAGQPPAQYTPPAPPAQTQQPAPIGTGTQNPGPTPTVNPTTQPTQTVTIPPSQCNNPDFC